MTDNTTAKVAEPTPPATTSLGHYPSGRWEFDQDVTDVFGDMLARSIPQIDSMREIVYRLSYRVIQPETDVVDLGCATGDGIVALVSDEKLNNRFVAIEASEPMLRAAKSRLQGVVGRKRLEFSSIDLRKEYPDVRASLTLCVLTLQFIPVEHRQRLLSRVRETTVPGGGMIVVEKILGECALINDWLTEEYYQHKRAMGYTEAAIQAKRESLQGVLVPLTASWNEQLLLGAGFRHVECFWRYLNFCGWIALA